VAIASMLRLHAHGPLNLLDPLLLRCTQAGCLHPEPASAFLSNSQVLSCGTAENPYTALLSSLQELTYDLQLHLPKKQSTNSARALAAHVDAGERQDFSTDDMGDVYRAFTCGHTCLQVGCMDAQQVDKLADTSRFAWEDFGPLGEARLIAYAAPPTDAAIADQWFAERGFTFSRDYIEHYIAEVGEQTQRVVAELDEARASIATHQELLGHLGHIKSLDVNFDKLFSARYLHLHFGRMPAHRYRQMDQNDDLPCLFYAFDTTNKDCWCMYVCAEQDAQMVKERFANTYDFEPMHLPDAFTHGTAADVIRQLQEDIQADKATVAQLENRLCQLAASHAHGMLLTTLCLRQLHTAVDLRKYAVTDGETFHFFSFLPEAEAAMFTALCGSLPQVTLDTKPAEDTPAAEVPVLLKNTKLARPFEMFVGMYGLPEYTGLDPTPFVTGLYILLFGVMFGDVGQGLLLAICGFIFGRVKNSALGRIVGRVGLSSAFFGLLFGSCFGYEHWFDGMFEAIGLPWLPIHVMKPTTVSAIIIYSVLLGAALIVVAMGLSMFTFIKQKKPWKALLNINGMMGLMLYLGLWGFVGGMLLGRPLLPQPALLAMVAIPTVLLFFTEPLLRMLSREAPFEDGFGAFCIETLFEMFEVFMGLFSNTVSFLRVGAFTLSHAGMMGVVMLLAEGAGAGIGIAIIVLGNLFVMGMEGLIVGIQVLRLTFYEMFSRFYPGTGRAFEAVRVFETDTQSNQS